MHSKTELTDWALARLKGKIWQIRRIWAGRAFSFAKFMAKRGFFYL